MKLLPLGRSSSHGISKLRGDVNTLYIEDIKLLCVPTFHPSYVLRKQYMSDGETIKSQFENDIKNLAIKAKFIV